MAFRLHLDITARTGREHMPFLRRHLLRAHGVLHPALRELSLALVGQREMSRLHARFMKLGGPTDVLSFALDGDARGRVTSGEVIACVAEARRNARRHRVSVRNELLLYALHGMLHLCGFDDRTVAGYRKMHRTEDWLLTKLGIGPVFAGPPVASGGAKPRAGG